MRIWIDLGNSPHVPFFGVLAKEFERRGHSVLWTARDYAQTVELAQTAGIDAEVFGTHGGKSVFQKGGKFVGRIWNLLRWARGKKSIWSFRIILKNRLLLPEFCEKKA